MISAQHISPAQIFQKPQAKPKLGWDDLPYDIQEVILRVKERLEWEEEERGDYGMCVEAYSRIREINDEYFQDEDEDEEQDEASGADIAIDCLKSALKLAGCELGGLECWLEISDQKFNETMENHGDQVRDLLTDLKMKNA